MLVVFIGQSSVYARAYQLKYSEAHDLFGSGQSGRERLEGDEDVVSQVVFIEQSSVEDAEDVGSIYWTK